MTTAPKFGQLPDLSAGEFIRESFINEIVRRVNRRVETTGRISVHEGDFSISYNVDPQYPCDRYGVLEDIEHWDTFGDYTDTPAGNTPDRWDDVLSVRCTRLYFDRRWNRWDSPPIYEDPVRVYLPNWPLFFPWGLSRWDIDSGDQGRGTQPVLTNCNHLCVYQDEDTGRWMSQAQPNQLYYARVTTKVTAAACNGGIYTMGQGEAQIHRKEVQPNGSIILRPVTWLATLAPQQAGEPNRFPGITAGAAVIFPVTYFGIDEIEVDEYIQIELDGDCQWDIMKRLCVDPCNL